MARIFISYKRVDKEKVFKIKDYIEAAIGEKCWIDLDGIESDAQFKNIIIKAINECEIVLFMYSKAHSKIVDFEKDWTVRELNFAAYKNKRIVFINIDNSSLTDEFIFDYGTKQHVDASSQNEMNKLINDIAHWLKIEETHIIPPPEELTLFLEGVHWGFRSLDRKYVIPATFDHANNFCEGLASVALHGRWGYIDSSGKKIIECNYGSANDFHEGVACVRKNGKFGFIDKNNNIVIPFLYRRALDFKNGIAYVLDGDKWGGINAQGQTVIPFVYNNVRDIEVGHPRL